jgi:hypothetical protein
MLTTTRSFAKEFCSCSISCRHPLVVGTPPAAGTWVESPSAESRRALDHSSRGTGTSPGRHPSTPSWVHDLLHRLACRGSICSPLSRLPWSLLPLFNLLPLQATTHGCCRMLL